MSIVFYCRFYSVLKFFLTISFLIFSVVDHYSTLGSKTAFVPLETEVVAKPHTSNSTQTSQVKWNWMYPIVSQGKPDKNGVRPLSFPFISDANIKDYGLLDLILRYTPYKYKNYSTEKSKAWKQVENVDPSSDHCAGPRLAPASAPTCALAVTVARQ